MRLRVRALGMLVLGATILAAPAPAKAEASCLSLLFAASKTLPACAGVFEGTGDLQSCVAGLSAVTGLAVACGNDIGGYLALLVQIMGPADYSQVDCAWTPYGSVWHGWCEACGNLLDREGVPWNLNTLAETCRQRFLPTWGSSVWSSGGAGPGSHSPDMQDPDGQTGTGASGWGIFTGGFGSGSVSIGTQHCYVVTCDDGTIEIHCTQG